ncbi:hypothetical protein pb186bvf_006617 [Paramecium bursaria]
MLRLFLWFKYQQEIILKKEPLKGLKSSIQKISSLFLKVDQHSFLRILKFLFRVIKSPFLKKKNYNQFLLNFIIIKISFSYSIFFLIGYMQIQLRLL